MPEKKRSPWPWILGILGIAAVVAIVLVLVFVVFKGDNGGDTSGPEGTVNTFFEALEKKDVDLLLSTIDPEALEELEDVLGMDVEEFFEDFFFAFIPDDFKVEGAKYETEIDGDKATVTAVGGTMSFTDPETGEEVVEDAGAGDTEPFELILIDGKWYLTGDTLDLGGMDDTMLDDTTYPDDGTMDDGTTDGDTVVELPIDTEEEIFYQIGYYYPDAADWFMMTDYPLYEITDEGTTYAVQLYEEFDGETYTYGWYIVDKETGVVEEYVE
jgi:hypothetical protein